MEILTQILERWNGPMPKFFKVIFWVSAGIVAISTGANLFIEQITSVGIVPPQWLTDVAGWVGAAAAIVAKFTVDWKKKAEQESLTNFIKATTSARARK